jgi:BirA family biotin operon repressor/biotin-[acetyl-CoA-carboxylase] ligase
MRVVTLDRVGSTNDEVAARIGSGEPMPLAVRALEQDAGRGRRGRAWASPRGGVWMSAAGPCGEPLEPGAVALRAVLAVRDAVGPELGADGANRLRVKWPNDLLLDGEKVAGVLCERRAIDSDEPAPGSGAVVVGVGINADFDRRELPPGVRTPATTLRSALGRAVDADAIADRLASGLGRVLARVGEPLSGDELRSVLDRLAYLEGSVRFERVGGGFVEGVLAGLAPDGRAVVRVGGALEWVVSGDVDRAGGAPDLL